MKTIQIKTKEECLLMNGVMAYDLGKVEKQVMMAMDEYASQFHQSGEVELPSQLEIEEKCPYKFQYGFKHRERWIEGAEWVIEAIGKRLNSSNNI